MREPPSPNGRNGRGRFAPGNPGGPGNPHAAKVGRLRSALLDTVSEQDIADVAAHLVALAKSGDLPAIRELLLRVLGRPVEADLLERIERLESTLSGRVTGAA